MFVVFFGSPSGLEATKGPQRRACAYHHRTGSHAACRATRPKTDGPTPKNTRDGGRWTCEPAQTDDRYRRRGSRKHRRETPPKQAERANASPTPTRRQQPARRTTQQTETTKTQRACKRRTRCERPPPCPPACNASTQARANDVPTPPKPPQRGVARVTSPDAHDAHPQTRVPTSDEQPRARANKATCSCAAVKTCGVRGTRRQTPTRR